MVGKKKPSRHQEKIITGLEEEERALISLILMNNGRISGTTLKRIYLDCYTLWEMQNIERKLVDKGLLLKFGGTMSGEGIEYEVPKEVVVLLLNSLSSEKSRPDTKEQLETTPVACCGEFSILWYLWQIDSILNIRLFRPKSRKKREWASKKRAEEALGLDRDSLRLLISLHKGLLTTAFWKDKRYNNWSDMISSPQNVVRAIFMFQRDTLRERNDLGRGDVGIDNIDFFFEELASLKIGRWQSLRAFVSNAKSILFSCNQPFRWIHFDEARIWRILYQELRMLGIVETALDKDKEKYFRLTALGAYCLGSISERKLEKEMTPQKGKFMVHPNFEITLVINELAPTILLKLAMLSEPTTVDTASVFRITRKSVKQGLRLGLTTAEMIDFLKKNSRNEIPQNVEYSIKDWGA